jgi:hypothetical protein
MPLIILTKYNTLNALYYIFNRFKKIYKYYLYLRALAYIK